MSRGLVKAIAMITVIAFFLVSILAIGFSIFGK
jgi:hypothetical protein